MTRRRNEPFRITQFRRIYNREEGKFTFNISYETHTKITPRSLVVAEAFGLGIDEAQKFKVLDAELKIGPKTSFTSQGIVAAAKAFCCEQSGQILAKKPLIYQRLQWIQTSP